MPHLMPRSVPLAGACPAPRPWPPAHGARPATLAAARPATPAPARAFIHWVAAPTAASVPLVRARVRAVLEGWRTAAELTDSLLLAVSELVGNVVRHAPGAPGRMRVGISCGGGWLRLEVADQAPALPRLPDPGAVGADPDAEGGRGLLLVQLLVAEASGELSVPAHQFGKSVRVRVPVV
ncbi:ATP-binding protein [Streptomyces sp. NPDC046161]|uniref:ATP-binding protein n=1 Tax=Streptomyces sp. NPDC046161 TaxID=3155132 RepID=UPI0033E3490E